MIMVCGSGSEYVNVPADNNNNNNNNNIELKITLFITEHWIFVWNSRYPPWTQTPLESATCKHSSIRFPDFCLLWSNLNLGAGSDSKPEPKRIKLIPNETFPFYLFTLYASETWNTKA
jgi:hypothetical protein